MTSAARLLSALVAADSGNPPGDERAVAAVIEAAARELGLPRATRHARAERRPNLVYELAGSDPSAPTLLLGAHMDTVPADDLARWDGSPHRLRAVEGRWVGLGVADMKGAIVALLLAAARLRPTLRGRLVLAFTADEEEASGHGVEWLCQERLLRADAAVLLEPGSCTTGSWDALYVAERGSCVVQLTAHGLAGHSGAPVARDGRAGMALLDALAALRDAPLFARHRHAVDGTPPIVNLPTMLAGGVTPWSHPESFQATLEIRTVPGMSADGVLAELRAVLDAHGLSPRTTVAIDSWGEPGAPVTDPRLLGAAEHALQQVLGRTPAHAVFPASTDAGHLAAIGIPTLPALGPGTLAAVHRPGEWLRQDDLERAAELVAALVTAYAG